MSKIYGISKKNSSLLIFILILLISFFSFLPKNVFASENYDTSYSIIYDVTQEKLTRVILNIGLKNKTTEFFPTSYSVQTGFDEILDVQVSDPTGPLKYKTEKTELGTQISFDFKDKTVGKGNTQEFSISFDTNEIINNLGSVKEINIPAISNQEELLTYNIEVKVPSNSNKPSILKPKVSDSKFKDNSILFSKNDLQKGGISIAYGDIQTYKFELKYNLKNNSLLPEITYITIPSNNSYQEVTIDDINPRPENVIKDIDGNWLAKYKLLPSKNLKVTVSGNAILSYLPKSEKLSAQAKELFTRKQSYWDTTDSEIKKIANELKTPEAIYKYTVDNLTYDVNRVKDSNSRIGGKEIIKNPNSAGSIEFTDLFISLARSAGIPARAVEGYANTSNSAYRPLSFVNDILHSWPQYWNESKQAWIMVDPTWENATNGIDYFNVFDFDHLAFVIKGEKSDYPIPAGGHIESRSKSEKNIKVTSVDSFQKDEPKIIITTNFSKIFYGGLPIEGSLIITNDSNIITPSFNFEVEVDNLSPNSQELNINQIPPFGNEVIPIKLHPAKFLTNQTYKVKITIGQETLVKEIVVLPFYRSVYFAYLFGGILSGILIFIISFVIYRSRRLHFPK